MSDANRSEAAIRDLSTTRAELHRWIRRAREAERMIEQTRQVHEAELTERDGEVARLTAELARLAAEVAGLTAKLAALTLTESGDGSRFAA